MSEHTPTTEEVRLEYARYIFAPIPDSPKYAQFDRWLAEHDREVAEKAWAEGARWAAVECGAIDRVENVWLTEGDNPHRAAPTESEGT